MEKMEEVKRHWGKVASPPYSNFLPGQERMMAPRCHILEGGDSRKWEIHPRKVNQDVSLKSSLPGVTEAGRGWLPGYNF